MMITDSGVIIRVQADEISKIGRATQGVRIMKLKDDKFKVMAIALTPHEDEEEVEYDEDGNVIVREESVDEQVQAQESAETTESTETTENSEN